MPLRVPEKPSKPPSRQNATWDTREAYKPPQRLDSPYPPPDPRQSSELRLLLALIDEAIGTAGAYESALLREQERASGQLSPAVRWLGDEHPLLPVFAEGDAVTAIIGATDERGDWHPGVAMLSERESSTIRFAINGFGSADIRDMLDRRRGRRQVPMLAIETVERYLRDALRKLRGWMVLDMEGE